MTHRVGIVKNIKSYVEEGYIHAIVDIGGGDYVLAYADVNKKFYVRYNSRVSLKYIEEEGVGFYEIVKVL